MTKGQRDTCDKCIKCNALVNKYFLKLGTCVWCLRRAS